MPTQTLTPTTAANDPAFGTFAWLGLPARVQADDGQAACPATGMAYHHATQGLAATGFGFTVPEDAGEVSVTFRVKRKRTGIATIRDSAVRLTLVGVVRAADVSGTTDWPAVYEWAEYTFPGLSPADVNDAGFGFLLAAANVTPPGGEIVPKAVPFVEVVQAVANW